MNRIQTNKLVVDLNIDMLSNSYDVFKIKTCETHFGKGKNAAKLVDDFVNEKFVLSVVYDHGNSFYMMLRKSNGNRISISKALKRFQGTENVSLEEVSISMVPQNIMVQLLMNSLGSYEGSILGFHNVTGHFFMHHPSWIKSKGKQLIALELKVTKDMLLVWFVRTFTSISQQKLIRFGKKKFGDYPEYVIGKDRLLKRIEKGSDPGAFILRQIGDKKSNIKFLEIDTIDNFRKTKMGVICDCIDKFNTTFCGMAHIEFDSLSEYQEEQVSARLVREMEKQFERLSSFHRVVLIDSVLDSTSPLCIEALKQKLTDRFNCEVSTLKRPRTGSINIILIHEDAYYDGKEDLHDKVYTSCAVQHITIETVAHLMDSDDDKDSGWKSVLDCIMQEAIIKEDIYSKHISLVNWTDYGYTEKLIFGICHNDKDEKQRYYFMTISPDGRFTIEEQENTLFEQNNYQDCIEIFGKEDVVGVVKKGEDINVIHNTNLRTIPEIELIKDRLKNGDNKLRNKESREELFPAITDIKSFAENEHSLYYFSGIIGAGMRNVIPTAVNIRMVDAYRFSKLFFDDLLKLMAVTFVRNGQLTIMPFPFKYLIEFVRGID